MVIKGFTDPKNIFRKFYPLDGNNVKVKHFVIRTITPDNPFGPHKHEQEELWYIINGRAVYTEDNIEYNVEAGDLIYIKSQVLHGLHTNSKTEWICLG